MFTFNRNFLLLLVGLSLVAWWPVPVDAQVFVYPRRASQSQVRYFEFDWRHIDILVGPEAEGMATERGPRAHPELPRHGHHSGGQGLPHDVHEHGWRHGPWGGHRPGVRPFFREEGALEQAPPGDDPVPGEPAEGGTGEGVPVPPTGPDGPDPGREGVEADEDPPLLPDPDEEVEPRPPIVVDEAPDPKSGGVRLYFYERERHVAELAAASIAESYSYLIDRFDFVPPVTFPYVLYNTYMEFLSTNLFPLQEGVLGVTSPRTLLVALPYFGDHRLFHDVSTHELAHEFTIQKVNARAREAGVAGQPLERIPLWFIEGLAEYYTHDGIDAQTTMLVTDLLVNPDAERGYVLRDFFEDRIHGFLWTYKMGQVRCAFLEETYGEGTIQQVLDRSPELIAAFGERPEASDFRHLLSRVTGDSPERISAKFDVWVKKRFLPRWLEATQPASEVERVLPNGPRFVQAMASSADGHLVLVRSFDAETGTSQLRLMDTRRPEYRRVVVQDGVPGFESLHPVAGRNFALGTDKLAFIAEANGRDVVYVQEVRRIERDDRPERVRLGNRRAFPLDRYGLLAAESISFSPDGDHLAIVGQDVDGQRDIFTIDLRRRANGRAARLTVDIFGERSVSWGPDGIVFSSDATEHGRYNLFRIDPERPEEVHRLTSEPRDHKDPIALPDGRVVFTAYDEGRANLYQVGEGEVVPLTDLPVGLFDAAAGPDGSLLALQHHQGRRRPVRLTHTLEDPRPMAAAEPGDPRVLSRMMLDDAEQYRAFALRNWELGQIFAAGGGGTGGIVAHVVASANDRMRNHVMLLNVSVLGSFELTDGHLVYINQEHREIWGLTAFQSLHFRIDEPVPDGPVFLSYERFLGAGALLRHPFSRFTYLQGSLAAGTVSYAIPPYTREFLRVVEGGTAAMDTWQDTFEGRRFQTEATLGLGYNTLRTHWMTGPISGSAFLFEVTGDWQPMEQTTFGAGRFDGEHYFLLFGRTHILARMGVGQAFGGELARQFYLSSFDTLRGVPYGDLDWLLGRSFLFSTAELQFPLNPLIRVFFLSDIEGVAGFDFGGVGPDPLGAWDRRVLNGVLGVNLGVYPIVFRVHFARPIPIGAELPAEQWVPNLSIAWAWQ